MRLKYRFIDLRRDKSHKNIIEVGIDHEVYSHTTKFSEDNIKALSADFN